jgi:hypothetical protein
VLSIGNSYSGKDDAGLAIVPSQAFDVVVFHDVVSATSPQRGALRGPNSQ